MGSSGQLSRSCLVVNKQYGVCTQGVAPPAAPPAGNPRQPKPLHPAGTDTSSAAPPLLKIFSTFLKSHSTFSNSAHSPYISYSHVFKSSTRAFYTLSTSSITLSSTLSPFFHLCPLSCFYYLHVSLHFRLPRFQVVHKTLLNLIHFLHNSLFHFLSSTCVR